MGAERYGNWLVIEELGRGGQGTVYKAIKAGSDSQWYGDMIDGIKGASAALTLEKNHEAADRLYGAIERRLRGSHAEVSALKVLHPPQDRDEAYKKAQKRMQSEIEALASISHPNLMRVLDHDPDAEWVAFEYCEQGTLLDDLGRFKGDAVAAVNAFSGIVAATAELHRAGAVHRDIKPANIFLGTDGRLILGDLGLIYFEDSACTRVTETFEKVGTTDFMPSWMISVGRIDQVQPSFDVFSLGKILWCLVSGERVLPLHYVEKPQYDLRERFPSDAGIALVHERILKKTVVEEETGCLSTASELLVLTDEVIRLLDAERARICKFCSKGKYLGDAGAIVGTSKRHMLFCDSCGHVLEFRAEHPFKPPWWVHELQDDLGRIN